MHLWLCLLFCFGICFGSKNVSLGSGGNLIWSAWKGSRRWNEAAKIWLTFTLRQSSCWPHEAETMKRRQLDLLPIVPMLPEAPCVAAHIDASTRFPRCALLENSDVVRAAEVASLLRHVKLLHHCLWFTKFETLYLYIYIFSLWAGYKKKRWVDSCVAIVRWSVCKLVQELPHPHPTRQPRFIKASCQWWCTLFL